MFVNGLNFRIRVRLIALFCLIFVSVPLIAAAQQPKDLVKWLPESTEVIAGVNVSNFHQTHVYGELMQWLRTMPTLQAHFRFLDQTAKIDLAKDVRSVVIGMPEYTHARTAQADVNFSVVLEGNFKESEIKKAISAQFPSMTTRKEGKTEVLNVDEVDVAFLQKNILVVTQGSNDYRAGAWKSIISKKSSATKNKKLASLLKEPETATNNVWIVANAEKVSQMSGPQATGAAFFFDFQKGLAFKLVATMAGDAAAQQVVEQLDQLKQKGIEHPMVTIIGLAPVLNNLKVDKDKATVRVTTSMTDQEVKSFIGSLKQILRQQFQQGMAPNAPMPPSPSQTPDDAPQRSGVPADFN